MRIAPGERGHSVARSHELPARGHKAFYAYRTASMDARGGNPNLSPQSKAKAVSKASACIVKDTSAVYPSQKSLGDSVVFRHHAIRMTAPILMNVLNRLIQSADQIKKLKEDNARMKKELIAEQAERRKLHDDIEEMKGNIRVFARLRPMSASERARGCRAAATCPPAADGGYGERVVLETGKKQGLGGTGGVTKEFRFNRCFTGSNQDDVFRDVAHLVQSAVDGVNAWGRGQRRWSARRNALRRHGGPRRIWTGAAPLPGRGFRLGR